MVNVSRVESVAERARTALPVLMLACWLLPAIPTQAQAQGNVGFVGVSEVDLVIERLDPEDAKCNVTADGLDAAARIPLDGSRLRLDSIKTADYVYVNVLVLPVTSTLCAATARVSLNRALGSLNTDLPAGTVIIGAVWTRHTILTGSPSDFGQRVNKTVTDLTNLLIAEWIKANPRR